MNRKTHRISHNRLNRYMIKTYKVNHMSKKERTHRKRNNIKKVMN